MQWSAVALALLVWPATAAGQAPAPGLPPCAADVRVPSDQCTRHSDVAFSPDAPGRGLFPTLRVIVDASGTNGAARTGALARGLVTAGAIARMPLPWGWPDATVRFAAQWRPGPTAAAFVGDLQALSNIDGPPFRGRVSDAWVEVPLAGELLRTKIGHFDANQDYAFAEAASPFSHSAFSFSQNIFVLPTYPRPATGVHLYATPRRGVYAKIGVADGAGAADVTPSVRWPWQVPGGRTRFEIAEAGVDNSPLTKDRVARLALGGWRHSGTFTRFDGGTTSRAAGAYVVAEGTLWDASRGQDDRAFVSGFLMAATTDPALTAMSRHVGVGISGFGLWQGRPDDVWGLAVSRMQLSPQAGLQGAAETALEAVWRVACGTGCMVAPTLTLVGNPGGASPGRWARVFTVRVVWHSRHG
jgi:carbohydrate-selective porin OprB